MLKRVSVAMFALTLSSTLCFAHSPIGHYSVEGKNPDGGDTYTGTVDVTKTGETYQIVWHIGSKTTVGTGLGGDGYLAVSYQSGDNTGIALYGDNDGAWAGMWTYAGGNRVGGEVWRRD